MYNIRWEKQGRARSARAGEGHPRHEGAFAFLRLKLNDLVHTLGGIFKSKKKIHIHGKCVFLTLG